MPLAEPNIIALELVIGVPRAPGDPYTNEPELQVLNLLETRGFAVEYPDGWVPQLPTIKNGGLWADSALSAGRQLIAGEMGNVTETMTLTATGATVESYLYLKSRLLEFARRAKAFHTDWAEQQPVYLKFHAPKAPCAQYAIVYSIDIAQETDAFEIIPLDTLVITVEREPAWRMGVPPGGNPIEWTYFVQNRQRGPDYQYDDMSLDSANSLVAASISNRHEWTYNAGNPVTAPSSKNYVDISASQVPGDAPALCCIVTTATISAASYMRRLLIWLSSRDMSLVDQDGGLPMASAYIMNAADMGWTGTGAFTGGTAAQAVFNTAAVPARQYRTIGPVAGPAVTIGTGRSDNGINNTWRRQFLRGRLALFVRVHVTSGASNDTKISIAISERQEVTTLGAGDIVLPDVFIPVVTSTTGDYNLLYCGQFTLPLEAKAYPGANGRGIRMRSADSDLRFTFTFINNVAAARTVEFLDAILVPYDEAFAQMRIDDHFGNTFENFILDNTGYLGRGDPRDIAVRTASASSGLNTPQNAIDLRGNAPLLLPRTDQRLHFLNEISLSSAYISKPNTDMTVRVNIIPRCYGVAAL